MYAKVKVVQESQKLKKKINLQKICLSFNSENIIFRTLVYLFNLFSCIVRTNTYARI